MGYAALDAEAERQEACVAGREGASLGPYLLAQRLGAGNIGEVYRAQGPTTGADSTGQAALKILSGGARDATTREIARQVEVVASLKQPHIIPLYGIVEAGDSLAVAMAYAPGGSLGDTLRTVRPDGSRKLTLPLAPGVVARLVNQLAHALAALHAQGIAHGDLKPNNIFVRTSPSGAPFAVICDFGQSVLTTAAASLATQNPTPPDWVASQLLFAAPEQTMGTTLPASDQYALAAIVYLLLTGETLYAGSPTELLRAIQHETVAPPSSLNPSLSSETDSVLATALAKQPEARYPSIEEFARALDHALAVSVSSGVTQQFAQLAASTPGMRKPPAALSGETPTATTAGGMRIFDRSGAGVEKATAPRQRTDSESLEVESPRMTRRLAILTSVAVLLLALACALGFQMFASGSLFPHVRAITGSDTRQPTATTNPTIVAEARTSVEQLRTAESGNPTFSDALLSNGKQWKADGSTAFFAADGLHLRNKSTSAVAAIDAPRALSPVSSFVSQVDVALVKGVNGDQAGMRFLVQTEPSGATDFYSYLVSSEGRFSIWMTQAGTWTELTSGYSSALKVGFNQPNTLAVLVTSDQRATFFANQKFVTELPLARTGPASGSVGLLVFDGGAEARFSYLSVYSVGQ